tara:strand:- start:621 stop:1589 length:969 start_codon:yes stop_codon:yes gene_type:complete
MRDWFKSRGFFKKGVQRTRKNTFVEGLSDLPAKRKSKRMGIIYLIRFRNGKGYIGQTIQKLSERVKQHMKSSSGCKALQAAVRKHGRDALCVSVLAIVSEDELNVEECRLISEHNTLVPNGYNLLHGGEQMRDEASQEAMRQARIASQLFQAARREVQARPSTTLARRQTVTVKRQAKAVGMDVVKADRMHYNAWRKALNAAHHAADKLPQGSLRDPVAEVEAFYGAGPPARDPVAVATIKAKESVRISGQRRDHAKRKREERVAGMDPIEASEFMKQARWNALYVAKTRTPDKLKEVEARWEREWEEFEARQRTQDPPASC